jgi:hypothetical protein
MASWRCLKQCGACCHLDPADRPDLPEYLSPEEIELYLSLVGEGGWCIHYDPQRQIIFSGCMELPELSLTNLRSPVAISTLKVSTVKIVQK